MQPQPDLSASLDVLAIGESMVMLTPMIPEALVEATTLRMDVGGAESNVAMHLGVWQPGYWGA